MKGLTRWQWQPFSIALIIALLPVSAAGTQLSPQDAFLVVLTTSGGSGDPKSVATLGDKGEQLVSLFSAPSLTLGVRYFGSNASDPMTNSDRTVFVANRFRTTCDQMGMLPGTSQSVDVVKKFVAAQLARTSNPERYSAYVNLCEYQHRTIGALITVQRHPSDGLIASFRPKGVAFLLDPAQLDQLTGLPMVRAHAAEQQRIADDLAHAQFLREAEAAAKRDQAMTEWRKQLAVGDHTNCGLVVDLRGPLVRVQLPWGISDPSNQRELWVQRKLLYDTSSWEPCHHE